MAGSLKDYDFWLSQQFLTDDDTLMEKKKSTAVKGCGDGNKGFISRDFMYGFASDLCSPVESVVGSTESDEEDYLNGLTRQMAHSTLADEFRNPIDGYATENTMAWAMAGSPPSTLCALGSGCGCKHGSSRGSPTGPFQVKSSPPATWDLLYAAVGEVARMRINEERFGFNSHGGLLGGPQIKPSPISVPLKSPTLDLGFQSNNTISQQQFQATQFQQMKQQQMMKQQSHTIWREQLKVAARNQQHHQQAHQMVGRIRARNAEIVGNRGNRQIGLSVSEWPSLQQPQQNGVGMRAAYLGAPGAKRECAGTGVFLPRRVGYPPETRKKPACLTALLPSSMVQALNSNLDDIGAAPKLPQPPQIQPLLNRSSSSDSVAAPRIRSNNVLFQAQQKHSIMSQPVMNHEIMLPREWTY